MYDSNKTKKITPERKDEIISDLLNEFLEGADDICFDILRNIMTNEEIEAYGYDF